MEELSIAALTREIALQDRPNWILAKMMNLLEDKRQERGMGWSRPWNKSGLMVFRTHIVHPRQDAEYHQALADVVAKLAGDLPAHALAFAQDLMRDPANMSFTFYHNRTEGPEQYEGLTLSVGRVAADGPRHRDRLDLILEDKRDASGAVDGVIDRLRLYVCPWATFQHREYTLLDVQPSGELAQTVSWTHRLALDKYNLWKAEDDRQWSHWASNFIDYFGPRSFIPQGSAFT
jgi:hypothetical protein